MVPTGTRIVSIFTIGVVLNMIILHQLVLFIFYLKEARREKLNWCKRFLSKSAEITSSIL